MKNASQILTIIGRVFNIVNLAVNVLITLLSIIALFYVNDIAALIPAEYIGELDPTVYTQMAIIGILVSAIFSTGLYLAAYIFAVKSMNALKQNDKEKGPYITFIVIGALTSIFYLLGGIFGLIASRKSEAKVIE